MAVYSTSMFILWVLYKDHEQRDLAQGWFEKASRDSDGVQILQLGMYHFTGRTELQLHGL